MFLNFHIENFFSIGNIDVDFAISESQKIDNTAAEVHGNFVNKLLCIVGPNASGKTNVLRAISAFCSFIEMSYLDRTAQMMPHFFHADKPTKFSAKFIKNDEQYDYSLELSLDNGQVKIIKEQLRRKDKNTQSYRAIFTRNGNKISKIKLNKLDQDRLKPDVTLFSFLKNLGYLEKEKIKSFGNFATNVNFTNQIKVFQPADIALLNFSRIISESPQLLKAISEEVKKIDVGISDLRIVDVASSTSNDKGVKIKEGNVKMLMTMQESGKKTFSLPLFASSQGTISYVELFYIITNMLKIGGMLIVDELESSLHTDLVERILNLFMKEETNPHNAQILFSTHNPLFLQYLTKTQILISEKNEELETEVFRLDEVKGVRNDENYFLKYLAGAYDGKPKIKGAVSING